MSQTSTSYLRTPESVGARRLPKRVFLALRMESSNRWEPHFSIDMKRQIILPKFDYGHLYEFENLEPAASLLISVPMRAVQPGASAELRMHVLTRPEDCCPYHIVGGHDREPCVGHRPSGEPWIMQDWYRMRMEHSKTTWMLDFHA